MARFALYTDTTNGVGAMRVSRDDANDPWTVTRGDVGKLSFDSSDPNQVTLLDAFFSDEDDFNAPSNNNKRAYPSGNNNPTATDVWYISRVSFDRIGLLVQNAYGITYPPMGFSRRLDNDGWVGVQRTNSNVNTDVGNYSEGNLETFTAENVIVDDGRMYKTAFGSGENISGYGGAIVQNNWPSSSFSEPYDVQTIVWPLPCDDSVWTPPSQSPVSGSVFARLTTQDVIVPRSGFDITQGQNLISTSESPFMLLDTGEVSVASGATVNVTLPDDIDYTDAEIFVDCIVYAVGETIAYPTFYVGTPGNFPNWRQGASAKVSGNTLSLRNDGSRQAQIRYLVFKVTKAGTGVGTSDQMLRSDGSTVQILRSNASSPPRLNDILFDTRFPYAPIVAEGWWNIPKGSNAGSPKSPYTHTVTVEGLTGNYLLYPVFMNRIVSPGGQEFFQPPMTTVLVGRNQNGSYSVWHGAFGSQTTYATIVNNVVTFHAYPDHPFTTEAGSNPFGTVVSPRYESFYPRSMRYYIFGIPT
ncbi:MAG: hypothetical protein AAGG69_00605 [Pseudomonadota bacterium]